MTEEQEGVEETSDENGPTAEGREEAEDVVEELKENEDEIEGADGE